MAETVYLNDGSMEIILVDRGEFLENLIRDKLGDDAARCFVEYVTGLAEEISLTNESTAEQERSADSYIQMCHNACDTFREILDLLDTPRLNRKALRGAVQKGFDDLYKNL